MNVILEKDICEFVQRFRFASELKNSRILITGATGMIGSALVYCLQSLHIGLHITLPVRSTDKAETLFGHDSRDLSIIGCDLGAFLENIKESYDYIIHCASPTSGEYMTRFPLETLDMVYQTTLSLIKYSKLHNIRGMVFLSSIESYGQILDGNLTVSEDVEGYIDIKSPRSSYPFGKRAAEFLCLASSREYGLPIKVARLTQTFGPNISYSDNRVFAQFARSVILKKDIILHSNGQSAKPYCDLVEGIEALLYILIRGNDGEVYNVSNDDTYISIYDLAIYLQKNFNPQIQVRIEPHPERGYAPITKLRLSSEKLQKLGWKPQCGLYEMFAKLIDYMKLMY